MYLEKKMSSEEKILLYSVLAIVCLLVPPLPNKAIENFLRSLGLIASIVFYSLAFVGLEKLEKNVYYKLSYGFLIATSVIYALYALFFILMLIGAIAIFVKFYTDIR